MHFNRVEKIIDELRYFGGLDDLMSAKTVEEGWEIVRKYTGTIVDSLPPTAKNCLVVRLQQEFPVDLNTCGFLHITDDVLDDHQYCHATTSAELCTCMASQKQCIIRVRHERPRASLSLGVR